MRESHETQSNIKHFITVIITKISIIDNANLYYIVIYRS